MFRAPQNAFDDVVVKATDENLTSENWEFILDVCDKVASGDSGAKDAVASMIKRLAHRNANVQLYTLELANSLSKNCGSKMHRELASRSFTDALLRLAADRNTHHQVKAKILERMAEWKEMFSKDSDLGIMEQAYMRLKSQNPYLHPPSKPGKTQTTKFERDREEEELQMALSLSLKDKSEPREANQAAAATANAPQPQGRPSLPQGSTAATVSRVRALHDFTPTEPGELAFRRGDIIAVLESVYKDWWKGSLWGDTGIFPLNYVEKLRDPTQEEINREASMEAEVFGQMGNVEKLLALLSTRSREVGDVRENEEITTLYHSTLAIRPKLIELIGKYSQKKDDFTQLNEKFIKARRDYENLLEASMSHPPAPAHGYGRHPYQPGPRQQYPPGAGYMGPHPQQHQQQPPRQPQYQRIPPPGGHRLSQSYGQPPPDQRIYSPVAELQQPQYPPQNGPAPFYILPPEQQQSQAHLNQRTSPKPGSTDPYASNARQASGSVIGPVGVGYPPQNLVAAPAAQELATSSFEVPSDHQDGFPSAQMRLQQQLQQQLQQEQTGYYPPQQQQQPQVAAQRQPSLELPTPVYSAPTAAQTQQSLPLPTTYPQPQQQQQQQRNEEPIPSQPNHAPTAREAYAEPAPQPRYSLSVQPQPSQPPPDADGAAVLTGQYPPMPSSPTGTYYGQPGQGGSTLRAGVGDEEGFYR